MERDANQINARRQRAVAFRFDRGDPMNWRDQTWEFVLSTLFWLVAIMVLAGVVAFVAYDAIKTRRRRMTRR